MHGQVKSLERRVARYKVLLGEDVVNKDDLISSLKDELASYQEQLTLKTDELNSSTAELSQVQTILNSMNEKWVTRLTHCILWNYFIWTVKRYQRTFSL